VITSSAPGLHILGSGGEISVKVPEKKMMREKRNLKTHLDVELIIATL
jgi:hypothetical protein